MGKIYNINAEKSLVDVLAERFFALYKDKPEELAEVLFLLPSRRACQNLKEAFVRQNGRAPTILPQIRPLADDEDDEFYLSGNADFSFSLKPAVPPFYRALVLTKMIMRTPKQWGLGDISAAQAYALAQNLSELIDLTRENNLSFDNITNIVREEYAEHWQQILQLLAIITLHWPKILQEEGYIDSSARKAELLREQIKIWQQNPPTQKIVIAGTTAGFPLLKELVKTVLSFADSEVYLYGVDNYLSENDWDKIDENHPQFELKELLDFLKLKRSDVLPLESVKMSAKQRFVSEIMRPASTTAEWQKIVHNKFCADDFDYLKIINCDDLRQEAYAIALIMRETLETPEKTAALVTTDRNLARRTVAELKRWNIIADDSSGQPLHLSPIGIYLRLIVNVLEQDFSKVSLLALLKHPFTKCSMAADEYKIAVYHLERKWRNDKNAQNLSAEQENLLNFLYAALKPLNDLYFAPQLNFAQMFEIHIKTAEKLADTPNKSGDKIIWRQEAGMTAAKFVAQFSTQAQILGDIPSNDYAKMLTALLAERSVRVQFGQHPRLKILGPIEARLQHFNVTIIGEANEGKWPETAQADMWMSRPMKKEFGMPLPERAIGIAAADFAHLLHGEKVYVTRAEKDGGTPTTKSRWLLRLETVLAANYADLPEKEIKAAYEFIYDKKFVNWSKNLERSSSEEISAHKLNPPAPKPPLYARPRKLSAGKFAEWMADPYSIFARYILQLYPLENLDKPQSAADYGNLIHDMLAEFNSKYSSAYPPREKAVDELEKIALKLMEERSIPSETAAFWKPNVAAAIEWIVETEEKYRQNVKLLHNEVCGKFIYQAKGGDFALEARADRVEETVDGKINIIDYKTGTIPSKPSVKAGYSPQLSVEAIIAENGGFPPVRKGKIGKLSYWKINDKTVDFNEEESAEALKNAEKRIRSLIEVFDDDSTPYYSHPNPSQTSSNHDYEHLSRYSEWSVKDYSETLKDDN